MCACLDLSVSSSSWGRGGAAVCDCGTPWTFLLPFFYTSGRQLSGQMYFYFLFYCDKNNFDS